MKKFASIFCLASSVFALSSAQAVVCDLTTSSTCTIDTIYGTAIFTTDFTRPTGTGVFQPFLSIQANGVEEGYNTSAKQGVFDTKREPQWNHEIRVSDLERVSISGQDYYSFLIDVNEPNGTSGKSEISLDMLQIYTTQTAGKKTTNLSQLGTKRFDLDLPSDSFIKYDDQNSGSGQGDIAFFIPVSAFAGASSSDYVYMYQKWGVSVSADFTGTTQGGFEETAIGRGVRPVPETATVLPLLGVLGMVLGGRQIRRRRTA